MARKIADPKLDTRSARLRLPVTDTPVFIRVMKGCHLGYRRSAGTWIGRYTNPITGKRQFEPFGAADDVSDDTGLSFDEAQEKLREWIALVKRGKADYTVGESLDDYIRYLKNHKAESTAYDTEKRIEKYVRVLGEHKINELTKDTIEKWRDGLVNFKADTETARKQKDSANRILTMLKAALNKSFEDVKGILTDAEWRKVKPYPKVSESRKVFLTKAQSQRLVNKTQGELKNLIIAALCTGCRYGELIGAKAQHFNDGVFSVNAGKTGARDVFLDDAGSAFFAQQCAGKKPDDLIFTRDDGKPWGKSHLQRPFAEAAQRAKMPKDTVFYSLRHTYASQRLLAGINHQVLAENMGTSIRMLEKHYGKFMKGDRRAMMNATADNLELPASNVEAL